MSCDRITAVRQEAISDTVGMFLDGQEPLLTHPIGDAIDLYLDKKPHKHARSVTK